MTTIRMESVRVEHGSGEGRRAVLDGVSLHVAPGTAMALMGASGSGKSTLLQTLAALQTTTSGRVAWNGAAVRIDRRGRRRGMSRAAMPALVPQRAESALAGEQVGFDVGLTLSARGAPSPLVDASVEAAMARCGLGADFLHRDPLRLSGGEQRRVAIAAAVAHGPSVVLLDEPTAGLDAPARAAVARLITSEATSGHAVVVATHDQFDGAKIDRN